MAGRVAGAGMRYFQAGLAMGSAVRSLGGQTMCWVPPWICEIIVVRATFITPSKRTGPLMVANVVPAMVLRSSSLSSPALATACCRISTET